uniref:Lactamase_B domain-containing protein n=1 Tax=Ascaris lumbricoides TaxID=6252 RepID=A0A0M3IBP6_ASCLU
MGVVFGQDRWNHAPIYCTEETAQILPVITARKPQLRGIDERWITIIEVNVRKKMDGFWVTPLNANHIRGAVMYLFEGPAIKEGSVLCTGDFRADTHFYVQPSTILLLQEHIFGMIHVDNTYSESLEKEFPSREESLEEAVKVIRSLPNDANIYLVMNRVGREQFLLDLSERLQERIALHKWRQAIADAWELSDHFAKPDEETRIRTCRREETRALLQNENAYVIEVTMLASLKADVSVMLVFLFLKEN